MRALNIEPLLDYRNDSALRFWAMGFRLDSVEYKPEVGGIRGHFVCVCDRTEQFQIAIPYGNLGARGDPDYYNVYRMIERFGSMSRGHLIDDGYDFAMVDTMLRRGADFDVGATVAYEARRNMCFRGGNMRLNWPEHRWFYEELVKANEPRLCCVYADPQFYNTSELSWNQSRNPHPPPQPNPAAAVAP